MPNQSSLNAAGDTRLLIVKPDVIDLRDRFYNPSLAPLKQQDIPKADDLIVRDQHGESACTGFALAAVIDRQCKRDEMSDRVSTRMLFEMAKLHDDLPDQTTAGSTLRGALKGFFHNGVCSELDAPFAMVPGAAAWDMDVDTAIKARNISLGSYFRLNHEINDYHAAINEAGAIIASAKIHSGWANPRGGVIKVSSRMEGRHAFAIVGYTKDGFLIQNSWGTSWGKFDGLGGVALWTYEDWFEHVEDAWVLRLAVSSPRAFDVKFARSHAMFRGPKAAQTAIPPRRQDIHGHFIHLDDGRFVEHGRYTQNMGSIDATASLICKGARAPNTQTPYKHLLIVAHGALSNKTDIAKRIIAWKKVYKDNGIYPIHIMWETGFNNEIVNVVRDLLLKTKRRMGSDADHLDARLEELARPLGHKLWRDLKVTAGMTFTLQSDGGKAIRKLVKAAQQQPQLKVHFASVSAGAFLLAELAGVMADMGVSLETANLMAPACSIEHYKARIRPHIGKTIKSVRQYGLIDRRECDDAVEIYSKSLLYLVANALESRDEADLLGMHSGIKILNEREDTKLPEQHTVFLSGRDRSNTDAQSHSGFDRDQKTMNDIMRNILQKKLRSSRLFSQTHLSGY